MREKILYIKRLKKYYPVLGGVFRRKIAEVKAVDDVTIDIYKGECFGVVGESGCGKTTLAKTTIRLLDPTEGHIYFGVSEEIVNKISKLEQAIASEKGVETSRSLMSELWELYRKYDIATFKGSKLLKLRREMQIVYQDPTTSLNPRMLVKDIVGEPLLIHKVVEKREIPGRVLEMLKKVGLGEQHLYRYPHEFSGGQRQRIAIARALILQPKFVVLDEPTSAVDVSVRAQLLELFQELQKDMNLTYMFITHDLNVVECISNRVAVMYLGKIVELAETENIFKEPLHPYTQALTESAPVPDPTRKKLRAPLKGEVPSPINPPRGCRFHPRCRLASEICRVQEPLLTDIGNGHFVACHMITK